MIVTEIKRDVDSQSLDQLLNLMITTFELDLLEVCTLLERAFDHCQVIAGIFHQNQLIGAVFASQRDSEKEWLLSSPAVIHGNYSTEDVACRLLNFVENEIHYHGGAHIQLMPNLLNFFRQIDCSTVLKMRRTIKVLPDSFYTEQAYTQRRASDCLIVEGCLSKKL